MRSHNYLVKKSIACHRLFGINLKERKKAGVIQSTKLSSNYSKESIDFVYAHINMVTKGLRLSVKDNTHVYFFGASKNWCTASLFALAFR